MAKKNEMICGCYTDKDGIVFCKFHANAGLVRQIERPARRHPEIFS